MKITEKLNKRIAKMLEPTIQRFLYASYCVYCEHTSDIETMSFDDYSIAVRDCLEIEIDN